MSQVGHLLSRDLADLPVCHLSWGERAGERLYGGDFQVTGSLFHHYKWKTEPTHSCCSMVGNAGTVRLRPTALPGPP